MSGKTGKSGGRIVACIGGRPVRIGDKIKNLPPEVYMMDIEGVAAWNGVIREKAEVEKEAEAYLKKMALNDAVFSAEAWNPALFYRYRRTKKKRTRKKYEKRILTWFYGEVL